MLELKKINLLIPLGLIGCSKRTKLYDECVSDFQGAPPGVSAVCDGFLDRPLHDLFTHALGIAFVGFLIFAWTGPIVAVLKKKSNKNIGNSESIDRWDYLALLGTAMLGLIALIFIRSFLGNKHELVFFVIISMLPSIFHILLTTNKTE